MSDLESIIAKIPVVGHIENGVLVLPSDFDDTDE